MTFAQESWTTRRSHFTPLTPYRNVSHSPLPRYLQANLRSPSQAIQNALSTHPTTPITYSIHFQLYIFLLSSLTLHIQIKRARRNALRASVNWLSPPLPSSASDDSINVELITLLTRGLLLSQTVLTYSVYAIPLRFPLRPLLGTLMLAVWVVNPS